MQVTADETVTSSILTPFDAWDEYCDTPELLAVNECGMDCIKELTVTAIIADLDLGQSGAATNKVEYFWYAATDDTGSEESQCVKFGNSGGQFSTCEKPVNGVTDASTAFNDGSCKGTVIRNSDTKEFPEIIIDIQADQAFGEGNCVIFLVLDDKVLTVDSKYDVGEGLDAGQEGTGQIPITVCMLPRPCCPCCPCCACALGCAPAQLVTEPQRPVRADHARLRACGGRRPGASHGQVPDVWPAGQRLRQHPRALL